MHKMSLMLAAAMVLTQAANASAEDLKIGIQVPTTGSEATYGKDMENAIHMAVREINERGGVLGQKIVTTTADDVCNPQQAVTAASKLVSEGAVSVIGGYCSGATLATLKIYGDQGIPFVITASNSTKLIGANPGNAVLINSTVFDEVKTAMTLFEESGIKRLGIVNQGDAYSTDFAKLTRDKWTEAGKDVVAYEVTNKGEQDFSSLVTRLKSSNPDAILWTAYYADGALLIKQLRQAGYKGMIALGDGNNSPKLFEIAGAAAEGVFCFSNPTAEFLPAAKAFSESYKQAFGGDPGPYSSLSYDGMNLLAAAIEKAGVADKTKILAALKATQDFAGIAGTISFTQENTLARSNFVILVGKDGRWTLHKPAS